MTFCRRGNDYADVAQPFCLTGSSHEGGGDTAAVAHADRRPTRAPLLRPTCPRSLCLVCPFTVGGGGDGGEGLV